MGMHSDMGRAGKLAGENQTSSKISRGGRIKWLVTSILSLFLLFSMYAVQAHNLQTKMNWMFFDPATEAMIEARIDARVPGDTSPVLTVGDKLGIIIKVVPQDGTTTGVGGYIDFYVPNGTRVTDVAYLVADGAGGYIQAPMKGQSLIALGNGPVGTNCTAALADPTPGDGDNFKLGPNANGVTAEAVDPAGCHRGTIAGVYGDVGIFYSTHPDTAYSSWNAAPRGKCGLSAVFPDQPLPNTLLKNNSGDTYSPCNKFDAEQLSAWGMSAPHAPIVDPNGRGNAPWGTASGVPGPESGYQWAWDMDIWNPAWFSTKTIDVIAGKLDLAAPFGVITAADDGSFKGKTVIDGLVDFDGSGTITALDDGSVAGWRFIDGFLDLDTDGVTGEVDNPLNCVLNITACTVRGDNGRIRENTYNTAAAPIKAASHPTVRDAMIASITTGPFRRIQYPGSTISDDTPGLVSTVLGRAGSDASNLGWDLDAAPLPTTVSQEDTTSPKLVRWSIGQLTEFTPEYAWVEIEIVEADAADPAGIYDEQGCPLLHGDTFGGDAGGSDNGKDHLWRYYEPTEVTWNLCVAAGKVGTNSVVQVNGTQTWDVDVYNLGNDTLTNVRVEDLLPGGVTFLSANPPADSGPNPLVWNVGTLLPSQRFHADVTVKINSSGILRNTLTVFSDKTNVTVEDNTPSGSIVILNTDKSVNTASVAPGGSVQYTLNVNNTGTVTSGSPVIITDRLEPGFTFASLDSVLVNGANALPFTTVDASDPQNPVFTINTGIQAGQSLVLKFTANIDPDQEPGDYCNSYTAVANGIPRSTNDLACVTVGAGAIGDTIFYDWDGDGVQDAGTDLGIPGVTLELRDGVCTPGSNCPTTTTLSVPTDLDGDGDLEPVGSYLFAGLDVGNYTVVVTDAGGVLSGYTQTFDPDAACPGAGCDDQSAVSLAFDEQDFGIDFGYQPAGTGSIGDTVFEDKNNDGLHDPDGLDDTGGNSDDEDGIPGVSVTLYVDVNGNGVIDGSDYVIGTEVTDGSGNYSFGSLPEGFNYIVDVDESDADINSYFDTTYFPENYAFEGTSTDPRLVTNLAGAYTLADFGFKAVVPGSIGDQLFLDNDGDGIYDNGTGDDPLANVTVRLYLDDGDGVLDAGDTLLETTVTDVNGNYLFDLLPAGNYIVDVDQGDPDVPSGFVPSTDETLVALGQGEENLDVDFPFVQLLSKAVDKANATPGETLTYTLTPNYPGSLLLEQVTVRDLTPAGTTYVSNSDTPEADCEPAGGIVCTSGAGNVEWVLGTNLAAVPGVVPGTTATVTLNPLQDHNIEEFDTDDAGQTGDPLRLESTTDDNDKVAFVEFDLASIPAGARVESATMRFTVNGAKTGTTVNIHRMLTNWVEGNTSWDDANIGVADWLSTTCSGAAPAILDGFCFGAADYDAVADGAFGSGSTGLKTVPVTSLVREWLGDGVTMLPNEGVALIATGAQDTGDIQIRSEDNAARPALEVVYRTSPRLDNSISTSTTLTSGGTVLVSMVATSDREVTSVNASALTVLGAGGGVNPTVSCGAATPTNATLNAGNSFTTVFTRSCTVTPGTAIGQVRFQGSATGTWNAAPVNWANATSNSVIVSPPLTYQVTVNNPATVDPVLNTAEIFSFEQILPGETVCYPIADGGNTYAGAFENPADDYLFSWNSVSGFSYIGAPGTEHIEAATWSLDGTTLYSAARQQSVADAGADYFGRLDPSTGVFTGIGQVATASVLLEGTFGNFANPDIDGLSFDPLTGELFAIGRREGSLTDLDILFKINPATGRHVEDAFGAGVDYIPVTTNTLTPALYEIDDISFRPSDGVLFGIANGTSASPGDQDRLVRINKLTGAVTDVARLIDAGDALGVDDMEGISFHENGTLYGVTGDGSLNNDPDSLWTIDTSTGSATRLSALPTTNNATDWESIACELGGTTEGDPIIPPTESNEVETNLGALASIGDYVWVDTDGDGVQDAGETGLGGVTVTAYVDTNGNGVLDPGETTVAGSDTTDANGFYEIPNLNPTLDYIVTYNPNVAPASSYLPSTPTAIAVADTQLSGGTFFQDADFGLQPNVAATGTIGDQLWIDADEDGVLDAGESGTFLSGVTVNLYRDLDNDGIIDPGELVATTTTDANGEYLFENLTDDGYIVQVVSTTLPAGVSQVYDPDATLDHTTTATVSGGTGTLDADFGYNHTGSIGDQVFLDANGNNTYDAGIDTPLPFVPVYLYAGDGDANFEPSLNIIGGLVDVNGDGVIDAKDDGNLYGYEIIDGYIDVDGDGNGAGVPDTGDDGTAIFNGLDVIDGRLDVDDNGTADDTAAMSGADGFPIESTTTNGSGIYTFDNLKADDYWVRIDDTNPSITNGWFAENDVLEADLTAGQMRTDVDFPLDLAPPTDLNKQVRNVSDAGAFGPGPVQADISQVLEYSLAPDTSVTGLLTNVRVTDAVPAGTTYVADSDTPEATVTPADNATATQLSWLIGSNVAGSDGSTIGAASCPAFVELVADKDAHIDSSQPGENSGSSAKLNLDSNDILHTLLHFDVSSIPSGATIIGASLEVTVESGQNADRTFSVRELTFGPWTEGTGGEGLDACGGAGNGATWNAPNCTDTSTGWNGSGGNFGTSSPYGSEIANISPAIDEETYTADVTSAVVGWLGGINYGLVLLADGTETGTVKLHSAEAANGKEPTLVVRYTYPESTDCSPTVRDEFTNELFSNNDGSAAWSADWVEADFGQPSNPAAGKIQIVGGAGTAGYLAIDSENDDSADNSHLIYREADLTDADTAVLTYDLLQNGFDGAGVDREELVVQASNNGGTSWTTLETITTGTATGARNFNLVSLLGSVSDQTRIRFMQTFAKDDNKELRFDNVQIAWTIPVGTGTTTSISAGPTLMGHGDILTVTMTLTADGAISNIEPSALTVTDLNTESFSLSPVSCGSPTPTSDSTTGTGDPVTFTWTCQGFAGADVSNLTFEANAVGDETVADDFTFGTATSNSVLLTPDLRFRVTVIGGVDPVINQAFLNDDTFTFVNEPSNEVESPIRNSIGDFVWLDSDGDGVQDAGEGGLGGVTVCATNGFVTECAVTDVDGSYRIYGLADGVWDVYVDMGTLPAGFTATTATLHTTTSLSAGQIYDLADFGFRPPNEIDPNSIGDTVFLDADEDGLQDAGEAGIPGVTVNLYHDINGNGMIDAGDPVIATTTTDGSGNYLFGGLYDDDYIVEVEAPEGMEPVGGVGTVFTPNTGSIGDRVFLDSDGDGAEDEGEEGIGGVTVRLCSDASCATVLATTTTDANGDYVFNGLAAGTYYVEVTDTAVELTGLTATSANPTGVINLAAGENYDLADFGYEPAAGTAVIGDRLWVDTNGNGIQDEGEIGLAGVRVELVDGCTPSVDCPVATTDADGSYLFTGVAPGNYTVEVVTATVPAGYTLTGDPDATLNGITPVTVFAGDIVTTADFGYQPPATANGTVGDTVWHDVDGDGRFDMDVLNGRIDVNGDGVIDATDDARFVDAKIINGFVDVNNDGVIDATDDGSWNGFTIINGLIDLDGDGLSGETNGNDTITGVRESGISGVTINLVDDATGAIVATTTTDANGNYAFTGVPDGNYTVDVTDVNSQLAEMQLSSGADPTAVITMDSSVSPDIYAGADFGYQSQFSSVYQGENLAGGENNLDIDFPLNWAGQIGDYAWYDTDGDGFADAGEDPVVGATIALYRDDNGNGEIDVGESVIAVAETDASGNYLFDNLPPGDYIVKFDEQTVESASTPGLFSTMVATTGTTFPVSLGTGPGETLTYLQADAGFIEGAEVEGHVFHDVDSNGVLDGGEPGLEGITVTLSGTDISGNPVFLTAVTDAGGEYEFIVPPGDYTISYNTAERDALYPDLDTLTTPTSILVSPVAGSEVDGLDFGVDNTGSVGDTVFNDINSDGDQDGGDAGIAGVTMLLYADSDGNGLLDAGELAAGPLGIQVTGALGDYLFTGLADGDYIVVVDETTLPLAYTWNQTGDPDEAGQCSLCDAEGDATVSGGGAVLDVDFGYHIQGVTLHEVGGTIWTDANGNGIIDGGEALRLAGVTVTVWDDTDGDGIVDPGETVYGTDVTDAFGNWAVGGIPNGADVKVKVSENTISDPTLVQTGDPSVGQVGAACTVCDATWEISNITSSQPNVNFGYQPQPSSISGTVVNSTVDGDGLAETPTDTPAGTEVPLQGVLVTLIDLSDGSTVATTTTNANGFYQFTNLGPGDYQVVITEPLGYVGYADADGPKTIDVYNGRLDMNDDGVETPFDDGVFAGYDVIDGRLDINGDGVINANDDGTVSGFPVIDGEIDLNGGGVDATDDGSISDSGGSPTVITLTLATNEDLINQDFELVDNTTVAIDDDNNTLVNTPVSGDVLFNDFDPEGDTQIFQGFEDPQNPGVYVKNTTLTVVAGTDAEGDPVADAGDLLINNDGTYTFTPAYGFTGTVSIPYQLCDDGVPVMCDTAILTITVTGAPDPVNSSVNSVIANDDDNFSYDTDGNGAGDPVSGNVLDNDADPEGDSLVFQDFISQTNPNVNLNSGATLSGTNLEGNPVPDAGELTINPDGSYVFTPTAGFFGEVQVDYAVCDDAALPDRACTTATLTINVRADSTETAADTPAGGGSTNASNVNDPPVAGDDLSVTSMNAPVSGNWSNNDSESNSDDIRITVQNFDGTGSPTTSGNIDLDAPAGGSIATVTTEQGGTVEFFANGTYTYTPPTNYVGPDKVTYQICDVTVVTPQPLCDVATIYLLVTPQTDFGDAPDQTKMLPTNASPKAAKFKTRGAVSARHLIIPGLRMGARVDGESDGSQGPDTPYYVTADADDLASSPDDEDGTNFVGLEPDVTIVYRLGVKVTNQTPRDAMVSAWIDLDCDLDFQDDERATGRITTATHDANGNPLANASETRTVTTAAGYLDTRDLRGEVVAPGTVDDYVVLEWFANGSPLFTQSAVNANCSTQTAGGTNFVSYARVRITTDRGLSNGGLAIEDFFSPASPKPNGRAGDGEVEDFVFALNASTTPAVVGDFAATSALGGGAVVSWTTAAEMGALAFRLERLIDDQHWKRVHQAAWIPAQMDLQGADYLVLDEEAEEGLTYTYRIIEQTNQGKNETYGPFEVSVAAGSAELDSAAGFEVRDHYDIERIAENLIEREKAQLKLKASSNKGGGKGGGSGGGSSGDTTGTLLRVLVEDTGVYALTVQQIADALTTDTGQVSSNLNKGKFKLSTGGQNVGWYTDNQKLYFYGEAPDTRFSNSRTYWLEMKQTGTQMVSRNAGSASLTPVLFIDTQDFEGETQPFLSGTTDPESDYWFWKFLVAFGDFRTGVFELPVPDAQAADGELTVRLKGNATTPHVVTVSTVDGVPIGTINFTGNVEHTATMTIPAAAFTGDLLKLKLVLQNSPAGGFDSLYVDGFTVTWLRGSRAVNDKSKYPADGATSITGFSSNELVTLDIMQPKSPAWINGGSVTAGVVGYDYSANLSLGEYTTVTASSLLSPLLIEAVQAPGLSTSSNKADYVVITNDELLDAANALAAYRSNGLLTKVVRIQDIYDEFSYGEPIPDAMQAFAKASQSWNVAPRFFAILGDGSYDYRDILGTGYNLVSPKMFSGVNALFASDTTMGDLNDDGVPEVAFGRIPIKSVAEGLAYIDKLIAYESGIGEQPNLLLADNTDKGGDFEFSTHLMGEQVPGETIVLDLGKSTTGAIRTQLFSELGQGLRMINYVGHGGLDRVAVEGLIKNTDVPGMSNPVTPTFVGLTCLINNYSAPGTDGLGERLVVKPGGGMVVSWSASGESYNENATDIGVEFQRIQGDYERLGDAIIATFQARPVLVPIYTLMGDPALLIQ